ncbi:MAG: nitrous oxide reductase accessory protein NosL [Magnetococcales bacterium]|nr:nitrous oxide reductase accessory protein NosL [Magnetococcales bacterium]
MKRHWGFFSVLPLLLAACGAAQEQTPTALEPAKDTKATFCGMTLAEHPGPKGQIHVAGETVAWFSSVKDAFSYMKNEGATRRILAFYVNDMDRADWQHPQPGTWIAAKGAYFLLDSSKTSGMDVSEIIPFGNREAAQKWRESYGGRVLTYGEVLREAM